MAIVNCGFRIPGPVFRPYRYGLLGSVDIIAPSDPHWASGVTWDDELCSNVTSTLAGCSVITSAGAEDIPDKVPDGDGDHCCAEPFTVIGSFKCPPVGRPANDAFRIAVERLHLNEGRGVEEIFWTGLTDAGPIDGSLQGGNLSCSDPPVDVTPEGATDGLGIVAAMAVLESALAGCSAGLGAIHATYGLLPFMAEANLLDVDGDRLFTRSGVSLVFGRGYPGSGPDNVPAAAGQTWVFATGPLAIWRSDVFLTPPRLEEAVDRQLNDVTVFAERSYAVGWSCCLFAVRVATPNTVCCP